MLKVAVLISGRGSNLKSLMDACATSHFQAQIALVISNISEAKGLVHARAASIPTLVLSHTDYKDREAFDGALDEALEKHDIQLVCLAGFMRLLTSRFVERWRDRLINIHPSLLPAFPGLDVHQKALEEGVKLSGCTVHFVRAEVDAGPIILQAAVPVLPDDDEERLAARILEAEHKAYPFALKLIAEGRVSVIEERVFIAGAKVEGPFFSPSLET